MAFTDVVENLGLLLTKDGFRGKDIAELKKKYMNAVHMLIDEPLFNLTLHPKHIAKSYRTYVRSILMYGAELLNHVDRKPLYGLDEKLVSTMFR